MVLELFRARGSSLSADASDVKKYEPQCLALSLSLGILRYERCPCAPFRHSLWRWGVTCLSKDVSNETPDVTPCRASPPMPPCRTCLAQNAWCKTMSHLTAAGCTVFVLGNWCVYVYMYIYIYIYIYSSIQKWSNLGPRASVPKLDQLLDSLLAGVC